MTWFQWTMVALTAVGLFVTWIGIAVAVTRGVESIKRDLAKQIADEVLSRNQALAEEAAGRNRQIEEIRREFAAAQKTQDLNVGEMGAALRRFIESVEKEMHAIEIWGRDNYVQKGEFEKATDSIRADIKALGADIKSDIRDLKTDFTHQRH